MSAKFHDFKQQLINLLTLAFKQRTSLPARLADTDKPAGQFFIYLEVEGKPLLGSDDYVGRYVIVEPALGVEDKYRISFMESILGISSDHGPSIGTTGADSIVADFIVDFLVDGAIPSVAISTH